MWGQYFSELIAAAFIAMACGTFMVGLGVMVTIAYAVRLLKVWNEIEQ